MVKKLKRDYCIVKYRKLPLQHFDKETDEDIFYQPKSEANYWVKLPDNQKGGSKGLVDEFVQLIDFLDIQQLIFLDEVDKPWLAKHTLKRKDSKDLTEALEYFQSKNIDNHFKGGVLVDKDDFKEFLFNFTILTQCDSDFFFHNFIDDKQNVLFYIHYSGDVKVTTLNKTADMEFLEQIKKTNFIDV